MSREQYVNKDLTEIIVLLDASSSMRQLIEPVIENINSFVEDQKNNPGQCSVSIYTFASKHFFVDWQSNNFQDGNILQNIRSKQDVNNFVPITKEEYCANGNTPLNDAIMQLMEEVGADFASREFEERPGNVIFIVSTDGMENSSIKYPRIGNSFVSDAIKHQEDYYAWHFIFTGSDPRTYEQGEALNMLNVLRHAANERGIKSVYSVVSTKISQMRTGEVSNCSFTDEEKAKVES